MQMRFGVRQTLPCDRPYRAVRRISLFALGCAMPAIAAFLSVFPNAVETAYTDLLGQAIARILARISGLLSFSVVELALFCLTLCAVFVAARGAIDVTRRKRHGLNAAACGVLWLGAAGGIASITGYLAWGFNFARADLVTRLHWSGYADQPDTRQELVADCASLIDLTNREYEIALGARDQGKPSSPPESIAAMDASIEEAYGRVAERLRLDPWFGANRGRAKPVLASFAMSAVLVDGFYSPWTGEANFNRQMPLHDLPQALAHEKAHQRCVTNEDEANFFGFLACSYARDPYVRYSGYLFAQEQLLHELSRFDPNQVKELIAGRARGVERDIQESREFVRRHMGTISRLDAAVLDAYLRANRAPGGIQSYARSARLIILYARAVGNGQFR